jgi:hypothetical protein
VHRPVWWSGFLLGPCPPGRLQAVIYRWAGVGARRHAGGVNLDLDALAEAANAIAGSAVSWEMAVRIGQSLEITDALWDLVPVVVAAGERVDARPAAQAADLSPAARGLDDASRARIRSLGDAFTGCWMRRSPRSSPTRARWGR